MKMQRITMKVLLAAHWEVKSLEAERRSAIEGFQKL